MVTPLARLEQRLLSEGIPVLQLIGDGIDLRVVFSSRVTDAQRRMAYLIIADWNWCWNV